MKNKYDILIIGSGAGGGTIAQKLIPLARDGAKIAILESGPWFENEYFTQREIEMFDIFKDRGAWPTADGAITISTGEAVGGSTLMYTGVTFRLPDEVCKKWGVYGLTSENLKGRFDRLESDVHVIEPTPEMENKNNQLFRKGCEKLDLPINKIQLNIKSCEGMGFCNLGCAKGHKQGTLEVQLPKALEAGIEIIPNCEVRTINDQKVFAQIKATPKGTKGSDFPIGNIEFEAEKIILAGGTVGSSAILLRSGFQEKLPALGRFITLHPALTVYGLHPEKVNGHKGFPKVWYTNEFSEKEGFYLETAFYYPFVTTKNLGLWGKDLKYVMRNYNHLMAILILAHDKALFENQVILEKKGNPKIKYNLSKSTIEKLCKAQIEASKIFFAAGCNQAIMPAAKSNYFSKNEVPNGDFSKFISSKYFLLNKVPVASAHLQGGCRMGNDPQNSVTNEWGQVHGHPWLYVADGSLFPDSSHVNPYLTIMALADRVGEKILSQTSVVL